MPNAKLLTFLAATAILGAATTTRDASASFIDIGVQAGVMGRKLSDTTYKPGFNFQLHADLALIPPILMLGVYANGIPAGGKLTPEPKAGGTAQSVSFRTIGLRAKIKIPIPGAFTPYFIAGAGAVNGDFPDQDLEVCTTVAGVAGCTKRTVPHANKWFAEFVLGGGLMIEIAGPLVLTLEGAYRPTTGYSNDDYEKALQNQQQTAPPPSRNGFGWSAHGGLAISL